MYFLRSLLRTLCLLIQRTLVGILASRVPSLLPFPQCLPFLLDSLFLLARAREWILQFLRIINPSFTNFLMLMRELASEISLDSLGSSHSLFFPHFNIELESLFYKRKHTICFIFCCNLTGYFLYFFLN